MITAESVFLGKPGILGKSVDFFFHFVVFLESIKKTGARNSKFKEFLIKKVIKVQDILL